MFFCSSISSGKRWSEPLVDSDLHGKFESTSVKFEWNIFVGSYTCMLYLFIFSDSWDKSSFYNSDSNLPLFKWHNPNEHFTVEKLGKMLIVEDLPVSKICSVYNYS